MTIKCSKECNQEFRTLKEVSDHYNREHTPIGKLVNKFNEWADEAIDGLDSIDQLSEEHRKRIKLRVDTLEWAKQNLERLFKEVINEIL